MDILIKIYIFIKYFKFEVRVGLKSPLKNLKVENNIINLSIFNLLKF